jgi:putative Ca2+/H+ antiporter (TMEM165/GDT1 family)
MLRGRRAEAAACARTAPRPCAAPDCPARTPCAHSQDAKDADSSAAEEKEEAQEVVDGLRGGTEDTLKLILTTFTLVFAAEWGDKSFLATIALAAASSPLGVTVGAVAGHGVATGLAVAGGGFLSRYFSERVLQYVGGSLFLVFAAATVADLFIEGGVGK